MAVGGTIAVDLDGTLALYDRWRGIEHIGEPIPEMAKRVKDWLSKGIKVVIFTARASTPEAIPYIEAWTKKHFGRVIPVTNKKTFDIVELWDDRAVQVLPNTGIRVDSL